MVGSTTKDYTTSEVVGNIAGATTIGMVDITIGNYFAADFDVADASAIDDDAISPNDDRVSSFDGTTDL